MFEVASQRFDTRLQARWSIVFDTLGVPWTYKPATFVDSNGDEFTPAFWLPRERYWFDPVGPDQPSPAWWDPFASAACAECDEHPDEEILEGLKDPAECWPRVEVAERWQGLVCLHHGTVPDGEIGPNWSDCAWERAGYGMDVGHAGAYEWVLCPQCGAFGCEFRARAERLPCQCLPDAKFYNCGDPQLLSAYKAARWADLEASEDPEITRAAASAAACGWNRKAITSYELAKQAAELRPTELSTILERPGAPRSAARCVSACASLADAWRRDNPYVPCEVPGAEWACSQCDGYVCATCGERPADEEGGECQACAPMRRLTDAQARDELNQRVLEIARREKVPIARVHARINRVMGIRRRDEATLHALAVALNETDRWLAEPDTHHIAPRPAPITARELAGMDGAQLRAAINHLVNQVAGSQGCRIPLVHYRVNELMGVRERASASIENLRVGLRHLHWWLTTPPAFEDPDHSHSA